VDVDRVVVAAPPEVAEHLERLGEDWLEVADWDGRPPAPAARVDLWVPPYGVGADPEQVAATLDALPGLRVVQLLSAGVEPWSDVVPDEVTLCAGRGIHGGSTAELAVAATLAVVRDLPRYVGQQRRRTWERHSPDTVAGRNVLVLGAGDIGGRVAATFRTLDAEVYVAARRAREGVLSLADARGRLPQMDIVVVALPHTPETHGVVDGAFLAALPDGAIVVNVARGVIVDQEALTAELQSGRLRAALDVTDPEPLPSDDSLWTLPNVLITPHVGGGATGWETRARRLVESQVRALHAGTELQHVVSEGY
jgi:phosphoglycerate dehydrogenase-like enzyme